MPEKLHRCVDKVKGTGVKNPWAVCNASLKELEAQIREGGVGSGRRAELGQKLMPQEHRQGIKDKLKKYGGDILHGAATHGTDVSGILHHLTGMTEMQEGGVGSGRRQQSAKQRYPDKAKIGWKNMGVEDYVSKAMKDYQSGQTPFHTLTEGGVGSGRKKQFAKDKFGDPAHVGWKNYGIEGYIKKAERDYKSKQVKEIAQRYTNSFGKERSLNDIIRG